MIPIPIDARDRKPFVTIKFISNTLVNKYTIEVYLVGNGVCMCKCMPWHRGATSCATMQQICDGRRGYVLEAIRDKTP